MSYSTKTRSELQTLRNRFLAALTSDRLNSTNRVSIEGWISQIEVELIKQAPVAKPVAIVTAPVPSIRDMRNGSAAPRNVADQNRLQMSYLS